MGPDRQPSPSTVISSGKTSKSTPIRFVLVACEGENKINFAFNHENFQREGEREKSYNSVFVSSQSVMCMSFTELANSLTALL